MKNILSFLLFLLPLAAFAQYPNAPNKIVLGRQTTGDGLIYRTDSIPDWTPATNRDAWVAFDTVAGVLYYYEGGVWNSFAGGDGNGLFSVGNNGDTIRAQVIYIQPGGEFTYRDTAGTAFISLNENTATVTAGNAQIQAVKPLGYLLLQGDSLLLNTGGSYGTAGQVITATGDGGAFWQDGGDGNGIIDALPAGPVSIDAAGNSFFISNIGGEGSGLSTGLTGGVLGLFAFPGTFVSVSQNTVNVGGGIVGVSGDTVIVNANKISLAADTLDATNVTTFLGFPGGSDSQTLSTSNDTLTISGGNSVKVPITELLRDSVTTTTMTIDLETRYQKIVQIDMTSATNLTLTINNPTDAGVYTFHFLGVSGTDNVTWPANFYDFGGTALGTDALTTSTKYTCYYDSVEAKYYCE